MIDTLKYFVKDGVYKLNNSTDEFIFICLPSADTSIGKLIQYKYNEGIYEKTGISYFLNSYQMNHFLNLYKDFVQYE